jgi:hypothetical protein
MNSELGYGVAADLSRGPDTYSAKIAVPEPELAQALNEVDRVRTALGEARAILSDFVERMLTGPRPTDAAQAERTRQLLNGGITGEIRRQIEVTAEMTEDVLNLARQLRRIG